MLATLSLISMAASVRYRWVRSPGWIQPQGSAPVQSSADSEYTVKSRFYLTHLTRHSEV